MDATSWDNLIAAIQTTHTRMMINARVIPPRLFAFAQGQLCGHIHPRQRYRPDTELAHLAAMARFAATAGADECVLAWARTTHRKTSGGRPAGAEHVLHVLRASSEHHVLFRFPYLRRPLPAPADSRVGHGLAPATPRWLAPLVEVHDAALEPPIATLRERSFQPHPEDQHAADAPTGWVALRQLAEDLTAQGYQVRLTTPAPR